MKEQKKILDKVELIKSAVGECHHPLLSTHTGITREPLSIKKWLDTEFALKAEIQQIHVGDEDDEIKELKEWKPACEFSDSTLIAMFYDDPEDPFEAFAIFAYPYSIENKIALFGKMAKNIESDLNAETGLAITNIWIDLRHEEMVMAGTETIEMFQIDDKKITDPETLKGIRIGMLAAASLISNKPFKIS